MKHLMIALVLLLSPALSLAHDHADHAGSGVEGRLAELEQKQAEIYHTLAEKKAAGLAEKITERITISGLIEVEAGAEEVDFTDGSSDAGSDVVLATAQLGFGIAVTEGITGDLILLYEEDETPLEVDEAAINLTNDTWFARIGQQYVPFGNYHSHFISDPLTLELGETRETALLGGYGDDIFRLGVFVFNGDAEKLSEQEDHIRDWGVNLTVTPLEALELGASFISDLADTDAEILGGAAYGKRVGGWSAYFAYEPGPFGLAAEVLGAATDFADADLDGNGDGNGDQPLAWNLEVSWQVREDLELAARYEGSDEFADQPEAQYGLAGSWGVRENVVLSLEYLRGEFDAFAGGGEDSRNLVTAQLGLEF